MTRKHFIQLAKNLKNSRPVSPRTDNLSLWDQTVYEACLHQWKRSRDAVASACQMSNPGFDWDRFMAACSEKQS